MILRAAGAAGQDTRPGRGLVPQHDRGHQGRDPLPLRGHAATGGSVLGASVRPSLVLVGPRHPPPGPSGSGQTSQSVTGLVFH